MKQLKAFKHPAGKTSSREAGWCWPVFFLNFIWAMVAEMWGLGVGVLVFSIILGVVAASSGGGDALSNIVSIAINIIFGVNENTWTEKNLISRGFELRDTVTAANKDGAIALFLKNATA